MDKKVTVIIPCYNSSKYLPKLLDSLKNQTIGIENLLCVFVDMVPCTIKGADLNMVHGNPPEASNSS